MEVQMGAKDVLYHSLSTSKSKVMSLKDFVAPLAVKYYGVASSQVKQVVNKQNIVSMEIPTGAKDVLYHSLSISTRKVMSLKEFVAPLAVNYYGVASSQVKQVVNNPTVKPLVEWGGYIFSLKNSQVFGLGILALKGLFWFYGGSAGGAVGKLMKAPGQPGVMILRSVFERDPQAYFRNLRAP